MEKNQNNQENSIFWEAPEFEYHQKDVSWYWLSLILAIILLALAIWQRNFVFALFIVIAWLILVNLAGRFPSLWEFSIREEGISLKLKQGDEVKMYSWKDMESFDIKENPSSVEYKELKLKRKSKFSATISVPFKKNDEEKIINYIQKFIPREEFEESLAENLAKLIRF